MHLVHCGLFNDAPVPQAVRCSVKWLVNNEWEGMLKEATLV
jgi:hypothetical protein